MIKTVDFLGRPITRLIIGDNPINGHSYVNEIYTQDDLLGYYTEENVLRAMDESLDCGCNAWLPLGNDFMLRAIYHHQMREGKKLEFIFQSYAPIDFEVNLRMMATVKPLGVYHRGTDTDGFCEAGKFDILKDRIKMIKDVGIKAGLGTHVPEFMLRAEDEDWGCDFYAVCLHNSRKRGETAPSAFVTGKPHEFIFYMEDRPLMFEAIKAVAKPCIAFKLYAGGQVFRGKKQDQWAQAAEEAICETYANTKPNDIAAIGCFQRDFNQIKLAADIAKRVLGGASADA